MKKTIILTLFISLSAYAANEIQSFNAGASTCFAVVRELDGDVWYVSGQVFEAWGTGGRDADDYDIALTDKSGGMFVGNFDTNISAGYYYIIHTRPQMPHRTMPTRQRGWNTATGMGMSGLRAHYTRM